MTKILEYASFACSPSSPLPRPFFFKILPSSKGLVALSSDNSLREFDATSLRPLHDDILQNAGSNLRCLDSVGGQEPDIFATAGDDNCVKCWDLRSLKLAAEFHTRSQAHIISLAASPDGQFISAGTELYNHDAAVVEWDRRFPASPKHEFREGHSDDVTVVAYHPSNSSILLSGSTDGLLNVYDTTIIDEDDTIIQMANHGSAIHLASFLDDRHFFGVSSDENMSIYPSTVLNESPDEELPISLGDIRPQLNCGYTIDVVTRARLGNPILAVGNHNEPRVDLFGLKKLPDWSIDTTSTIRLLGAHGDEIIRSILVDERDEVVWTAGEDWKIRAWRSAFDADAAEDMGNKTPSAPSKRKAKRDQKERHKPY